MTYHGYPDNADQIGISLGPDGGLGFQTIYGNILEIELKVPAEESKFQFLDVATAETVHRWLGDWIAAHTETTP